MSQWAIQPAAVFAASPMVPVMVINHVEDAVPMAQPLSKGGIKVFEITLRTDAALAAIRQISEVIPDAMVWLARVINASQYDGTVVGSV